MDMNFPHFGQGRRAGAAADHAALMGRIAARQAATVPWHAAPIRHPSTQGAAGWLEPRMDIFAGRAAAARGAFHPALPVGPSQSRECEALVNLGVSVTGKPDSAIGVGTGREGAHAPSAGWTK